MEPPSIPPKIPPPLPPPIPPPQFPFEPPVISSSAPTVLTFYRMWCALVVVMHLAVVTYAVLVVRGVAEPSLSLVEELTTPKQGPEWDELIAEKRKEFGKVAPFLITFSALAALFYCYAIFAPRKRSGWRIGLIAICASIFPFFVTWVGIIPLVIFWCKPGVKRHFGIPG